MIVINYMFVISRIIALVRFTCTVDNYTLPGLVCTDNDLAFLQHMRNVKQYGQLQVLHVYVNISDQK